MTLTQCLGPAFDAAEDGTLLMRLAGAPAEAALPATGNGARVDPAKGLWTPAEHHAVQLDASRVDSPGNRLISTGNNWAAQILSETVVNPSATRPMLCFFTASLAAVFTIAAAEADTAGYTGWQLLGGIDTDRVTGTPPLAEIVTRRDQGVAAESRYRHTAELTGHLVIAPGATSTIRARCAMACFEFGFVKVVHLYTAIRGIGVTQ